MQSPTGSASRNRSRQRHGRTKDVGHSLNDHSAASLRRTMSSGGVSLHGGSFADSPLFSSGHSYQEDSEFPFPAAAGVGGGVLGSEKRGPKGGSLKYNNQLRRNRGGALSQSLMGGQDGGSVPLTVSRGSTGEFLPTGEVRGRSAAAAAAATSTRKVAAQRTFSAPNVLRDSVAQKNRKGQHVGGSNRHLRGSGGVNREGGGMGIVNSTRADTIGTAASAAAKDAIVHKGRRSISMDDPVWNTVPTIENTECIVCYYPFTDSDPAIKTVCRCGVTARLHLQCLESWRENNKAATGKAICPVCDAELAYRESL